MPPLSELLKRPPNVPEGGETFPLAELGRQNINLPADQQPPVANAIIRCPLPSLGQVNQDNLRQFYSSTAAKFRVFPITR